MRRAIPAGQWTLVGDGIIAGSDAVKKMKVRWEIVWRRQGGAEQVLVSWDHTYVRDPASPRGAIAYTDTAVGPAAAIGPEDELVMRMTVTGGDGGRWGPNGDGSSRNGSIPRIDLPQ